MAFTPLTPLEDNDIQPGTLWAHCPKLYSTLATQLLPTIYEVTRVEQYSVYFKRRGATGNGSGWDIEEFKERFILHDPKQGSFVQLALALAGLQACEGGVEMIQEALVRSDI